MNQNNIKSLLEQHSASEEEKTFLTGAETAQTADMNQSRVLSEFILGKRIEQAAANNIKANAASARAMFWLTVGLIGVGFAQAIVGVSQAYVASVQLSANKNIGSAQFILDLRNTLDGGRFQALVKGLEGSGHNYPVLKTFGADLLDAYLGHLETIADFISEGVVDVGMANQEF